jgi:HK97 family phage portal protein
MIMFKNPFRAIGEYFARQKQQEIMVNLIDMWQRNRPLADLWDVKRFTDDGYRRNALVFACVKEIATSISQPLLYAITVDSQGNENPLPPGHILTRLLSRPNPLIPSCSAFLRSAETHIDVAGNAYIYKRRTGTGLPIQLQLLRPDAVKPIPDNNGEITQYAYGFPPNEQKIPATDVIHEICDPDPMEPYRGLSPIAVLARWGDLDNFAADYLRAFFLNAGIPSGLLKFKTQTDEPTRRRAQEIWDENYGGLHGWHKIGVMDADVEYQEIGSKLRTMDLEGVFGQTECRICMTYGVPPILVGAWIGLLRSSYANYASARKSFYQETLMPKWKSLQDALTVGLAKEFGDYIELRYDLSEIDALQEERQVARDYAIAGWESGLLTKNEGRQIVGEAPDANGNVFKIKANEIMQPAAPEGTTPAPVAALPEADMRLLLPEEILAAIDWRDLHKIADGASPEIKKNCCRPSSIRPRASIRRLQ